MHIEITLTDIMSKLVVDDWGQCKGGKFGSLRAHVGLGLRMLQSKKMVEAKAFFEKRPGMSSYGLPSSRSTMLSAFERTSRNMAAMRLSARLGSVSGRMMRWLMMLWRG